MAKPTSKSSTKRRKAPRVQQPEAPSPRGSKPAGSKSLAPPGRSGQESAPRGVRINRRAADRLRDGHVWIYASDVEGVQIEEGEPPTLIPVADNRGLLLGTALYSPISQIALRLVSREAIDETAWLKLIKDRLHLAINRRVPLLVGEDRKSDSCRLCFSEADEIPGLIVDKYGELLIVQLLAKGLDSPAVRETVVEVLRNDKHLRPAAIWERADPRIRELEGLGAPQRGPLFAVHPDQPVTATQLRLNGLKFHYDVNAGQKTGAFLDQHANYKAAEDYARLLAPGGRALDVCTYQGGFALHLARVCKTVTGIDASHTSLEVAERNLAANRDVIGDKDVDWVEGDAFEVLRDWSEAGEKFDVIVLDPPAFAKSKRAVEGALRGYKELNLRAFKMLRPGGLLITCSCSHHVSWSDLEGAVASAAADAHRRVRLHERSGAAPDHPVILNLPETEYLKCLVLEVQN